MKILPEKSEKMEFLEQTPVRRKIFVNKNV
jgi:hypothetical protein